jgi:signal transduction histidine kinase
LAALGHLSASIAHEVNNPLGIIKNYLTIIDRQIQGEDDTRKNVAIVIEEVNRIAEIVKQLLDFYRPAIEEYGDVQLYSIINSTMGLIQKRFDDSGIEVIFENHLGDDCVITGSSDRIKQVFLNLMINAKDAMPDGGVLKIHTQIRNNEIEMSFSDTGKGIPAEDIPKIFEPFYTTKRESGTGLGLSVCYGIIRSHSGKISAENNAEGGATFIIRFPMKAKNNVI